MLLPGRNHQLYPNQDRILYKLAMNHAFVFIKVITMLCRQFLRALVKFHKCSYESCLRYPEINSGFRITIIQIYFPFLNKSFKIFYAT